MRLLTVWMILLLGPAPTFAQSQLIDSLREVAATATIDTVRADALNKLGWQLHFNYPDSADRYMQEALELSRQIGYDAGVAFAYVSLGGNEITRSNFPEARRYFLLALEVARANDDYPRIATFLVNVGYTYYV